MTDERSRPVDDLDVAAFTKLRDEIDRRSGAQLTIMGFSLVAFSTLAGFVLAAVEPRPYPLLLLVPLLSSAAGLLWLDHDRRIREIGDHIRDAFPGRTVTFETKSDELQENWTTRVLGFISPAVVVFPGTSVVAAAWYHSSSASYLAWLWYVGIALTMVNIVYLGFAFFGTRR